MIKLDKNSIIVTDEAISTELAERSYGERENDKLMLAPEECTYLKEKRLQFDVFDEKNKPMSYPQLMKRFAKTDKRFSYKYLIYRDLRNRGFCVKQGFKPEGDFKVYSRGQKPGTAQAIWLVHCLPEENNISFPEIMAHIKLAGNVRKKLIYAAIDKEGDITYYQVDNVKP